MSNRDICVSMLDDFTDAQLVNWAAILRTLKQTIADAVYSEVPNAETVAALQEGDEMLRTGKGQHFQGTAKEFFAMLDAEGDDDA